MNKENTITCIMCPVGCKIRVTENEEGYQIKGAACSNGEEYALQELSSPKRIVMSVIPCRHSTIPTVAVKTSQPVPKEAMFHVMNALSTVVIEAPVHVGDVLVQNIAGLHVDIIATRNAERIQ